MTDIIERAEATLEGISEAPWFAMDYDDNPGDEGVCLLSNHGGPRQRSFAYTGLGYSWISEDQAVADAEFIAAARDLVPGLIAELKAARAENERLHELADKWDNATEMSTGNPSIVAKEFAAEMKSCFGSGSLNDRR